MFKITAYLNAGMTREFQRATLFEAREVASRIVKEGLWVTEEDGTETYYPVCQLYKVKIQKVPDAA